MQAGQYAGDHSKNLFPSLTGVRFPLAIWVVAHHLTGSGRMLDRVVQGLPQAGQSFIDMAYVALGTFFVLSGFLLARNYGATEWSGRSLRKYAVARAARVYPIYLLSLLVVAPIAYQALATAPALGSLGDRAALVLSHVLLLQGWTGPMPVDWNTPAWSLSCEFFFYLCFPGVLWLLGKPTRRKLWITAAIAFALPTTVRALGIPGAWKPLLFFGDFLIGIVLAGCYDGLAHRRYRLAGRGHYLYLPAAFLFVGLIVGGAAIPRWGLLDAGLRLANAGLILGLALGGGLVERALSSGLVLAGGRITYAMYILHIPLLWWYKRTPAYLSLPPETAAFVYYVGLVLVSATVYRLVEEPANRWLRDSFSRARRRVPRAAVAEAPLHVRQSLIEVGD
ncbi:MAG TPA: acyltransferase [Bryobacteraceae bacterium]|nr:acyltransferase [Bryobacteraceae bacterium]